MKRCVCVFLISVACNANFLYSQQGFTTQICNPSFDDIIFDAVEDSQGNFYLVGKRKQPGDTIYSGIVIKLSNYGHLLHQEEIKFANSLIISKILLFNDSSVNIVGVLKKASNTNTDVLMYLTLDTSLHIKSSKILNGFPEQNFSDLRSLKRLKNGNIFLSGTAIGAQVSWVHFFTYIITSHGDSISLALLESGLLNDAIEVPDKDIYIFFSMSRLNIFNSSFCLDTVIQLNRSIDNITALLSSSGEIFLSGNTTRSGFTGVYVTHASLGVIKLDSSYTENAFAQYGKTGDTLHIASYKGLDTKIPNIIYAGGISNFQPTMTAFNNVPSWITVSNIDSNLNIRWERFLGGDAYYELWSVLATSDGGCLLTGTRYDHLTQFEERDVVIIKIDSTGSITGVNNLPAIKLQEMILYPNPVEEELNIHVGGHTEIIRVEIYSMQGRLMVSYDDFLLHTIKVSNLPSGQYLLKASCRDGQVMTEKFLKD